MTGITGITFCHNAIERDYCLRECLLSMAPICDEIIFVDSESNDGTLEMVEKLGIMRTRILSVPFSLKTDGNRWLLKCINAARVAASSPFVLQLDADEVIHEEDYDKIKEAVYMGRPQWCWRYNFWKHPFQQLKEGNVVGNRVVRLLPTHYWLPSDEERTPEPPIRHDAIPADRLGDRPTERNPIRIYHYGFIRRLDAFVKKGLEMTAGYMGQSDDRINRLKTDGVSAFDQFATADKLIPFHGSHPAIMNEWISARPLK